jgi:hypothetical protein
MSEVCAVVANVVEIAFMKVLGTRYCDCCHEINRTDYEKAQEKLKIEQLDVAEVIHEIYTDVERRLSTGIDSFHSPEEKASVWGPGLYFLSKDLKYGLGLKKLQDKIRRSGDLIVGFYAEKDASFSLTINGMPICHHEMREGEFVWAYDDKYAIPLISLQYNDIFIQGSSDVVGVYGNLGTHERRKLAQYPARIGDNVIIQGGMWFTRVKLEADSKFVNFSNSDIDADDIKGPFTTIPMK